MKHTELLTQSPSPLLALNRGIAGMGTYRQQQSMIQKAYLRLVGRGGLGGLHVSSDNKIPT